MEVKFLKKIAKYIIILIFAMFIKGIMNIKISGITTGTIPEPIITNQIKKIKSLEYKEIDYKTEEITFKKPEFNYEKLNTIINEYIDMNTCSTLDYNIFKIKEDKVSVFLNCGKPQTIYYNYEKDKMFKFIDLVQNKDNFENIVRWLLNLKYPTFVTNEVSIPEGTYNIYENEIIGYFDTIDYGRISIKINNNEIEDMMDYTMVYDSTYENEIYTLDKTKKAVAFSYDDGPSNYDLEIIDALVNSHSKATFFVVGNRINSFKSSVEKMLVNGMEIGNHTYDHKYLKSMNKSQVMDEINRTNNIYNELTGLELKLFRPPYGAVNNSHIKGEGYSSILWSIDTLDWKSRNAESVYNIIMEEVKDGDIILMHSLYESTLEATKKVIPELYKQGYQIVSVSELFELKEKELESGISYLSVN